MPVVKGDMLQLHGSAGSDEQPAACGSRLRMPSAPVKIMQGWVGGRGGQNGVVTGWGGKIGTVKGAGSVAKISNFLSIPLFPIHLS